MFTALPRHRTPQVFSRELGMSSNAKSRLLETRSCWSTQSMHSLHSVAFRSWGSRCLRRKSRLKAFLWDLFLKLRSVQKVWISKTSQYSVQSVLSFWLAWLLRSKNSWTLRKDRRRARLSNLTKSRMRRMSSWSRIKLWLTKPSKDQLLLKKLRWMKSKWFQTRKLTSQQSKLLPMLAQNTSSHWDLNWLIPKISRLRSKTLCPMLTSLKLGWI